METPIYYFNYFKARYLNDEHAAIKIDKYPLAKKIIEVKMSKALKQQVQLLYKLREFNAKRAELPRENIFMRFLRDKYVNWQTNKITALHNKQMKYQNLMMMVVQKHDRALNQGDIFYDSIWDYIYPLTKDNLRRDLVPTNVHYSISEHIQRAATLLEELKNLDISYLEPSRLKCAYGELVNKRHNILEAKWRANYVLERFANEAIPDEIRKFFVTANKIACKADVYLQQNSRDLYRVLTESKTMAAIDSRINNAHLELTLGLFGRMQTSQDRTRYLNEQCQTLDSLMKLLKKLHNHYNREEEWSELDAAAMPRVASLECESITDMVNSVDRLQHMLDHNNFDYSALSANETYNVSLLLGLIQERRNEIKSLIP